jgi:hypothetical protein
VEVNKKGIEYIMQRLMNGFTFVQEMPLSLLYADYSEHRRLKVFANKGLDCVVCDLKGVRLIKSLDKGGGVHIDLYSEDWVLMTVDHIVSKKQAREMGWNQQQIEALENKQPMCTRCNHAKGCLDITLEELRYRIFHQRIAVIFKPLFNLLTMEPARSLTCELFSFESKGGNRSPLNKMPPKARKKLEKPHVRITLLSRI